MLRIRIRSHTSPVVLFVRSTHAQGPCDYNPKLEPRYHLEMPGSAPFLSGVPKSYNKRQAGPGPGQYVVHHSPLGANTSAGNVPNFSSPAQRGAWLRSDQVGSHMNSMRPHQDENKHIPFGRNTDRDLLDNGLGKQQPPTFPGNEVVGMPLSVTR